MDRATENSQLRNAAENCGNKNWQAIGKRGEAMGKQSLKYCQTMVKRSSNSCQTIAIEITIFIFIVFPVCT